MRRGRRLWHRDDVMRLPDGMMSGLDKVARVLVLFAFLGCSDSGPTTPTLDGVWKSVAFGNGSVAWSLSLGDGSGRITGTATSVYAPVSGLGTRTWDVEGTRSNGDVSMTFTYSYFMVSTATFAGRLAHRDTLTGTLDSENIRFARQ